MFSVSNYIISERDILFQGKIATIYKATQARSNSSCVLNEPREFAIKRVDVRYLQYCINEKQFLTQLKFYPHLFNEIIDIFKTPNHVYIVYPFYQGSLEKLIQNEKELLFEEIIDYISQIIDLFLILKSFGIIHRDMRPNNIIINDSKIKMTGFYSAIHENGLENCPNIYVSPLYMSPEFLKGSNFLFHYFYCIY